MSEEQPSLSLCLGYTLERAAVFRDGSAPVTVGHVLAAMLQMSEIDQGAGYLGWPALIYLREAGLKFDRQTREAIGALYPHERLEAAERAELARLKAKYEGGAA
jgi:hypothetical protein